MVHVISIPRLLLSKIIPLTQKVLVKVKLKTRIRFSYQPALPIANPVRQMEAENVTPDSATSATN